MSKEHRIQNSDVFGGSVWCTNCGWYWTNIAPYDREYRIPFCNHCKGPDYQQDKSKEYEE